VLSRHIELFGQKSSVAVKLAWENMEFHGGVIMEFWKINGNGNDFVTIEQMAAPRKSDVYAQMARRLCRRRASIGADGLLVVEPAADAHFKMRLFNADGSEGEMCGNGARCIARFAYERGLAPAEMTFETLAGLMRARVDGPFVEIDMGEYSFAQGWTDRELSAEGAAFRSCFLWVGVPHLVLFGADELSRADKVRIGRAFRNSFDLFPQGTNVSFARPVGRGEMEAVTYERDVEDLTDSCGTGCCAVALSAAALFHMSSPIEVHNPGGTNRITFDRLDETCFSVRLGGATAVVAKGETGPDA